MFPEFEHEGVSSRFTRKYVKLCSQSVSHDKQTKLLFSMRKVISTILVFGNVFRQESRVECIIVCRQPSAPAEASNYSSSPPRARTGKGTGVINPIREPGPAVISPEQSGPKSPQPHGRPQRGGTYSIAIQPRQQSHRRSNIFLLLFIAHSVGWD